MTKTPSSRSKKPSFLHVVYFVDSGSSRTLAIPLKRLKLLGTFLLAFAGLSIFSFLCVALLLNHIVKGDENIRELKSALIAQSIVHEDILRQGPFLLASGRNVISNRTSQGLAQALREGTSQSFEADELDLPDAEPAEEGVSAVEGEANSIETDAAARVLRAEVGPPIEASASRETSISSEPHGEVAEPSAGVRDIQTQETVALSAKGQPVTLSPVTFSLVKAIHQDSAKSVSLRFRVSKVSSVPGQIEGRFCAILDGVTSDGVSKELAYPIGFGKTPGDSKSCEKGMRIRINRFRDTSLDMPSSQELEITTARLYFATAGQIHEETVVLAR